MSIALRVRTLLCLGTFLCAVVVLAGCATYPANAPLHTYDAHAGYRFANLPPDAHNSNRLFVILAFSGGGTRAAALAYGVLEGLRDARVTVNGHTRSLLDEVDVISSISGGSFTAAYYGLYRNRIFTDFRRDVLYRPLQSQLTGLLLNPANWVRLASPTFGRIDLAAELYDDEIFHDKTFADLYASHRRPFILINATDLQAGAQFTFIQSQFDLICSNLDSFHVARAVAASSDFPVAFTPMTINNYAGSCEFHPPPWIATALDRRNLEANPRRFNRAQIAESYFATAPAAQGHVRPRRPYLHLLDGGIADNIGLRRPLTAIRSNDYAWNIPNMVNRGEIKKLVVITVDARTAPKSAVGETPRSPGLTQVIDYIASVPMANYSFDTVELLRSTFKDWSKDRKVYAQCQNYLQSACRAQMPFPPPPPLGLYDIYVGFDRIADPQQREHFRNLPTTLQLPRKDVDDLIAIGRKLLYESPAFQRLIETSRPTE